MYNRIMIIPIIAIIAPPAKKKSDAIKSFEVIFEIFLIQQIIPYNPIIKNITPTKQVTPVQK